MTRFKRMTGIIACMILCCQTMNAQDALSSIRKHYADMQERVKTNTELMNSEDMYPTPDYRQYSYVTNLPGSGYHQEQLMMFESTKENDYGEVIWSALEFATYKYNYGGRPFYEEYLYDSKGNIEFIYAKNPDVDDFSGGEFRFYYKGGKLFKAIVKVNNQQTSLLEETYSGATIPSQYTREHQAYYKRASKLKTFFDVSRQLQE